MKTGLTIQQMAQELLRQSKAKQDYLVNTGSLSLSVTSDAPQLRVMENGLDITILRQSAIFTLSNAILPKRVCTDTVSPRLRGAP